MLKILFLLQQTVTVVVAADLQLVSMNLKSHSDWLQVAATAATANNWKNSIFTATDCESRWLQQIWSLSEQTLSLIQIGCRSLQNRSGLQ